MKRNFTGMRFFKNPCSVCNNLQWNWDGDEYTSYSWAYCDEIDERVMDRLDLHKVFPNIEAPKKCARKNLFEFNKNFDTQYEHDYYYILGNCEDVLGVGFNLSCELDKPKIKLARRIAGGLANFNFRMRTFGRV